DFPGAVKHLGDTWLALTPEHVYRTDALSLVSIGSGWFRGLTAGGTTPPRRDNPLLDPAPPREPRGGGIRLGGSPGNIELGRVAGAGDLGHQLRDRDVGDLLRWRAGAGALGAEPADGREDRNHARPGDGFGGDSDLLPPGAGRPLLVRRRWCPADGADEPGA